jgi:putative oxidoreductase
MNDKISGTGKYSQWASLLLRLVMGYGFMLHGWVKLSRGPAKFEMLLEQIGTPFPHLTSWVIPFVELLGGVCILAGASVTIATIPLIATMLVAMFAVQFKHGFSSVNTTGLTANGPVFGPPGYEVNLLYIAGLLSLALGGAGAFSVDSLMASRKNSEGKPDLPIVAAGPGATPWLDLRAAPCRLRSRGYPDVAAPTCIPSTTPRTMIISTSAAMAPKR